MWMLAVYRDLHLLEARNINLGLPTCDQQAGYSSRHERAGAVLGSSSHRESSKQTGRKVRTA